jgi:hypothetical protein
MSFEEYYRHYLSQHQNRNCRRLHLLGMVFGVAVAVFLLFTPYAWWALAAPLLAYPLAWVGHFWFERNTPATWHHPLYALAADMRMTWDILRGHLAL